MSKHYAEFRVGDLFSLESTSSGIDGNKLNTTAGEIPYVTRSVNENGIKQYVTDKQIAGKNQDKGNVITIGLDTQTAYYQPVSFFTGQNVHILDHEKMSQKLAMYLIPQLIKIMQKYSWGGNGATLGRLREDTITLPITDASVDTDSPEPDWEYMESYIKEIEEKYLDSVEQYNRRNEDILDALHPDYHGEAPEAYDYAEFLLNDIFEIKNGVRLKSDDHIPGETPFISSREGNNGISDWVMNENDSLDSNVLGVNYNGNVLEAYYHAYDALFSDDVKRFKIKNTEPNRKKYMYLATAIKKLKESYSYTKKFNSTEISKVSITLPITSDGKPDWVFMEEYINFIEGGGRREIANYVQYKRRTS